MERAIQPDQPPHAPPRDHLSVCLLASGSRGNSIHVSDGASAILVDAGLSGVELERRMQSRGVDPGDLDAIL
ncbi:MAG: hypothetical protein GY859_10500, partial [Desulfobacterales bacterium]|nr:hypothetical protein [Desulfobacterales bacterium]